MAISIDKHSDNLYIVNCEDCELGEIVVFPQERSVAFQPNREIFRNLLTTEELQAIVSKMSELQKAFG